jgi:hypothetical protein
MLVSLSSNESYNNVDLTLYCSFFKNKFIRYVLTFLLHCCTTCLINEVSKCMAVGPLNPSHIIHCSLAFLNVYLTSAVVIMKKNQFNSIYMV